MRIIPIAQYLIVATIAAGALGAATRGPDSFGYTAINNVSSGSAPLGFPAPPTYSFVNIAASGGTRILGGVDDGTAQITLPSSFSFSFYGTFYNSLCVSTNGLINFGATCNSTFNNVDLSNAAPSPDLPTIAPLWTDLTFAKTGADAIYYQTTGTAPNRQFIVQWNNAYTQTSTSGLTFEVVLNETSSTILFQYQNVAVGLPGTVDNGASATVAIRNTGGQTGGNALEWSYDAAALANKMAILFSPPTCSSHCTVNVSSSISAITSGLLYSAVKKTYAGTVTVKNIGSQAIAYPIELVFSGLPSGVTVVSPTGTTGGQPYLAVPGSGTLAPNASASVAVTFSDPSKASISYAVITYSGGL